MSPLERNVANNINHIRTLRQISLAEIVRRLAETSRPIPLTGVRRILVEFTRRIDVDELAALAAALDVADPWSLTVAPGCDTCHGAPPPSMRCVKCGTEGAPA